MCKIYKYKQNDKIVYTNFKKQTTTKEKNVHFPYIYIYMLQFETINNFNKLTYAFLLLLLEYKKAT